MAQPDFESITQRIEDGSYFKEAHRWYALLFIGPISERIFFIIITIFSITILLFSCLALLYLLPIKPRIPFIYKTPDIINEIPRMIRLKEAYEPSNPALIKYYLKTFVEMRESYSESKFLTRRAFMKNYSDPRIFNQFDRISNPNNPRSPIRQYGKFSEIVVTISGIAYNRETNPAKARIYFSTQLQNLQVGQRGVGQRNDYVANIEFFYNDLTERDVINEDTGEITLDFDEPTFQVVGYDVTERFANAP